MMYKFDGTKSRPIANSEIFDFIKKEFTIDYLYDESVVPVFLKTYHEWLQNSSLNTLHGLDKFNQLGFVHGTTQTFDFFYLDNKSRRMRCFKGEFAYHKVTWNHNFPDWKYIEEDEIRENDAVIISLPFSDLGAEHPETQNILDQCDKLNVPVLIDCAYYSIARNLNFNLDRPCIKAVTFSLSKAFWGTERIRIGIRCTREYFDDTVNFYTSHQMVAKTAAGIGTKLCNTFSTDYNQNTFRDKQIKICKELKIQPSDCVIFGLTDKLHNKFGSYDRGTQWRRVCISKLLGDINYE